MVSIDSVLVSLLLNLNTLSITLRTLIFYLYINNFEQVLSCWNKELGFVASVLYVCSARNSARIQAKAKIMRGKI